MTTNRSAVRGRVVTRAAVYDDGVVVVDDGRISWSGPASDAPVVDLPEPGDGLVLPGLVDIHNHGGGGASYSSGDPEQVRTAARHHLAHGTTTVVAGLVSDRVEAMLAAVTAAADAADRGEVAAIYVEGPFLSRGRCGAQDPSQLRPPDLGLAAEIVAAGRGHVRVMTLAPELPGADRVAEWLRTRGVVPAVGHTEADAATVRRALDHDQEGLVTHLFNGMAPFHHRAPGAAAGALSAATAARTRVELVADGVHLDDETVRMVLTLLGSERVVLVTDAMSAAGMPDGSYDLGQHRVRVHNGVARLERGGPDDRLAGGTSHLLDVVRRQLRAGLDTTAVVRSASTTPATALGLDHEVGSLEPGRRADLLVLDERLALRGVMRAGRWLT